MIHAYIKMIGLLIVFSLFLVIPAHGQELKLLINEALINNPEIKKVELQYKVATEKVNEVNTLPNSEITAGYFVSEPETRTGAQRFKVSVKQMLPWFGTITARENYVHSLADNQYEDISVAKRKLMASVSQSYYNLWENNAKEKVLSENIALLKTYKKLALTSVEVGKASAVDVLKLHIRENEIEELKQVLKQQYLTEQTVFNAHLNRDETIAIDVVDSLGIYLEKDLVVSENLMVHPELVKYDKLYQSVEESELVNQKESKPLIGFGVDYVTVSERPNMNFNDNGKDIVMPFVVLSIPVFSKKYSSKTKQNELKLQEITFQKQERVNTLKTHLNTAIRNRTVSRIRYNTQLKNLVQSKNAEEILIKSYETGTIDFNDVLDIQELQLKIQMNKIEAIKEYYTQGIIINYLSN